jgi:hypothetical protein
MRTGEERFRVGNIHQQGFRQIWEGDRRRDLLRWVEDELDVRTCQPNCRMAAVNEHLGQLKNPPEHVNFI